MNRKGALHVMEMPGFMGSLFRISEWLMKFLLTNIVWLLFNFPIVYLGLAMVFSQTIDELYVYLSMIVILLPFVFFPATTAMFGVVRSWIIKRDTGRIFVSYWTCYRENYLRSLLGGLFYTVLWVIWVLNYTLSLVSIGSGLFYFYLALTIFLLSFTSYFFADTVHYNIGLFQSIKKTLLMTIFHVHYTLGAAGAVGIVLFIAYEVHLIFIILFAGSLITYIYFFAFHQIFLRAQAAK